MRSGAVLLYGISRVVIGENRAFCGSEDYVSSQGVDALVVDNQERRQLMKSFIENNPELWYDDSGE
jgi:cytosine deaminase